MHVITQMVAAKSERPSDAQVRLVTGRRMFLKRRWRGVAEDGTEFGFDLGTRLTNGCVFFQSGTLDYVICQEPECVYQIAPGSPGLAALVGWKIGNLHFPIQIVDGFIRVTHDLAVAQLIGREGWPFEEVSVVFNPMKAMPHDS